MGKDNKLGGNVRWLRPDDFRPTLYGEERDEPAQVIRFPLERVTRSRAPGLPEYLDDDGIYQPY